VTDRIHAGDGRPLPSEHDVQDGHGDQRRTGPPCFSQVHETLLSLISDRMYDYPITGGSICRPLTWIDYLKRVSSCLARVSTYSSSLVFACRTAS
jgi:hypothetical protein